MINDQDFLQIIDQTPLVSVDLIIRNQQGDILLGQRLNKPAQDYWFVPGGRIRKNETIQIAFERICLQELNVNIPFLQATLLGSYNHIYEDNFLGQPDINTHYVVLAYTLQLETDISIQPDRQHHSLNWWSVANILDDNNVHKNTKAYFL